MMGGFGHGMPGDFCQSTDEAVESIILCQRVQIGVQGIEQHIGGSGQARVTCDDGGKKR
ncbi:hypothetical protein D3C81_1948670 [compost metagenome]